MRLGWIFVVLLVAFAAWKLFGPGPTAVEPGEVQVSAGVDCVRRVHRAMDVLGDGARDLAPDSFTNPPFLPAFQTAWDAADVACRCPERGCVKAREALESLERGARGLGIPEQAAQAVMSLPQHLERASAVLIEADIAVRTSG